MQEIGAGHLFSAPFASRKPANIPGQEKQSATLSVLRGNELAYLGFVFTPTPPLLLIILPPAFTVAFMIEERSPRPFLEAVNV